MKYFLKMIEQANTFGCVTKYNHDEAKRFPLTAMEIKHFEECQPIVFMPKNLGPQDLMETEGPDIGPANVDLDSPFKVWSYEMSEGPITSPREYEKESGWEYKVSCLCIMVVELGPRQFGFYGLMEDLSEWGPLDKYNPLTVERGLYVVKTNSFANITEEFIKRLNVEKHGYEGTRTSVKVGSGQTKKRFRIRRVIHVASKSWVKKYEAQGGTVDYSHRFLVRGHWRKLEPKANGNESVGKDRTGDYCVTGFTWVDEFEKGPEHLPLIKKTRIVE